MLYDILIKNGLVFDGKGNKPEKGDIGIKDGEIKKIGDLKEEQAGEVIEAEGKYVAPGFIDLNTHSDTHWTIFNFPSQESFLRQGVTTILGGNCGSSLSPVLNDESLKDIERWTDLSNANINWRTVGEFLDEIEKHNIGVNFCTLIGFNTIYKSFKDYESIKVILKKSLDEGAFGMSAHFGAANFENFKEEDALKILDLLAKEDALLAHHLEDEGENFLPSVVKVVTLTRKTGVSSHITHFKALGRNTWGVFPNAIEIIKNAVDKKIKITCDFFPYTRTGSQLIMLLPLWFRKLPAEEALAILKNKTDFKRKNLLEYLNKITLHYDRITVASINSKFSVQGDTIEKLSQVLDLPCNEVILNLLEAGDLRVSIFNEVINGENLEMLVRENFSVIASDGVGYGKDTKFSFENKSDIPHPRSFGAFPKALQWFAKDKKIIPWEVAVHKMSGFPAQILGIKDRGIIAVGMKADIVIFDPEKIEDLSTYTNPFIYPNGIENVIVNGVSTISNGKITGNFSGNVLRK